MSHEIKSSNPAVDSHDLELFGARHQLRLPKAYCEFMLKHNGGRPSRAAFPIKGFSDNPIGRIQVFFGIHAEIKSSDIDVNLIEYFPHFPHGLLPIGCTDTGDLVCIDLRQSGNTVLFWDSKPSWGNNVWREEDLYPIAENFESFLDRLH